MDAIARIASVSTVDEPAVCPSCHVVSRLVHISEREALAATSTNLIPSLAPGEILRKARCILCTASDIPSVRAQEAHAGHIWFLIGESSDSTPIPPQAALNQHYWIAIANLTERQRYVARKQILEMAASKAFGCLQLPHMAISAEERTWLMGEMRRVLGEDAGSILGEDSVRAYIDQFGVPILLRTRTPRPEWANNVRFVPTPDGIEAYRRLYVVQEEQTSRPTSHRRAR